jgi:ribonuclease HI
MNCDEKEGLKININYRRVNKINSFGVRVNKVIIYTDGGSRGNPGKAAIGVVFCNEQEQEIKKFGEYLGDGLTNNEAEYRAVIFAFKKFPELFGSESIPQTYVEVRSDSELLVNQMSGRYKIKNENIRSFVVTIKKLTEGFAQVDYVAIRREKNKVADAMVNKALDEHIG